ncbi:segregation and condensation protein B [Lentilactobacillus fungorum]|uniref:Segregation and condensation protein B n=1 Tax=Lentilactobacillus fungorum TaxID=2201250 RepID=A0ABQ3VVT4_9LACO|nr:SMC-Scp complex subunit ScpB [Lentilactobacillus fungorum]GHP12748.1 segregation and condensation protein B [Lentilactobacillus fungorum]
MTVSNLAKIEALLYAAGDQGITLREVAQRTALSTAACRQLIERITEQFASNGDCGLQVLVSDDVYRLGTKDSLADLVNDYVNDAKPRVLSQAALETIAIIMYNQPVTRIEIDDIRGVNSSAIIHRLINQGLVEVAGIRQEVGNPKEYRATNFALDYFGLHSIKELPVLPSDEKLDDNTSDALLTRFNKEINHDKED